MSNMQLPEENIVQTASSPIPAADAAAVLRLSLEVARTLVALHDSDVREIAIEQIANDAVEVSPTQQRAGRSAEHRENCGGRPGAPRGPPRG
jgi:hypothetical protein